MTGTVLCQTCDADWSAGAYGPDCAECGGGALEIPCLLCEGRCGAVWKRAIMDSHDFEQAHWHGGCRLASPPE